MQICQVRKKRPPWTTYLFLFDGESTTKVTIVASQPKPHFHHPHQEKKTIWAFCELDLANSSSKLFCLFVFFFRKFDHDCKHNQMTKFFTRFKRYIPKWQWKKVVGRRTWGMFPSSVHKKKRVCKSFEMGITTKRHIHEHFMDKSLA
jgi:hypothetical protein